MESSRPKLPPNPCEEANILSQLLFTWTASFFKKGYSKVLELGDIYEALKCDKSNLLGDRLEVNWRKQTAKSTEPSLAVAIISTFWKEYFLLGVLYFFNDIFLRISQTILLGKLLMYFREDSTLTFEDAIGYAVGLVSLNALNILFTSQIWSRSFYYAMKMRVAVCSLIYRKALRLSQSALGETSPGKVVNLLSNDVSRFDYASLLFHAIWSGPLATCIVGYLIWTEFQYAGLIGIAIVFVVVPLQSYTSTLAVKFRLQTALRTDERVRFMDEIIAGVQVIKMYAWEVPFTRLIACARRVELKVARNAAFVRGLYMTFNMFTTRMAVFATMLAIALLYSADQLTAARVFVISSYFNIITYTMSQMFIRGLTEVGEALAGIKRLQTFLYMEEKNSSNRSFLTDYKTEKGAEQWAENLVPCISIKNATARWVMANKKTTANGTSNKQKEIRTQNEQDFEGRKRPTLDNLNADLLKGKLIGILGPVGAGKSSFLQAILRELPLESGVIAIDGSISYASQEPWIFAGTVRQNILFGEEYDEDRYNAVVKSCALLQDFIQLEDGDKTLIGERGASLSGGQKARINLARSTYRNADIYLLDDPLSAVDSHVGRHLFDQCIGPTSRLSQAKATRILVTHQVHFLTEADWLILIRNGKIEVQGSPSDLAASNIDFLNLIGMDESNNEEVNKKSISTSRQSSVRSISTTSSEHVDSEALEDEENSTNNNVNVQLESSSKGKVKGSVNISYFRAGAHWSVLSIIFALFLIVQTLGSGTDYWVSFWTKQEEIRVFNKNRDSTNSTSENEQNTLTSFELSTKNCIYVHSALVASVFIFGLARSLGFYTMCMRASQNLHDGMFKGLISTTIRFFDTNPSGRILNRFSKDLGTVDETLPKAIMDASQIILTTFGAIVVTSIVNPYSVAPIIIMAVMLFFIRKVFLKTSKNIQRLEGITKSPVFTHIAATLTGLSTIRAYGVEEILAKEFDYHQDTHTACWFTTLSIRAAFSLSLDVMCFIYLFCIIFIFLLLDTGVSGEKVGLAITQAMTLIGTLQWGVRQSAEISNHMTAVERVLEYRDLDKEKEPEKSMAVPANWPTKGCIEFRNVFYRYYKEADPVLCGLTLKIESMEKIGIVGRTGAGKSSLIGAIFRLACIEGEIFIDDIETSTIQLSDLRSHIAIIPQDPVLYSGTLRRNLDPFEEYPDESIWSALDEVELKEIASGSMGLQSPVMAHGSNFSVGQRQLLCLARAILRKNRILVLDEATANIDPQTDALIQQTIREKFENCTVLTVAHRLNTIIDSDRILVMETGRAIEFDEPHNLLQRKRGVFKGMVKALGNQEADRLSKLALEKYNSKQKVS